MPEPWTGELVGRMHNARVTIQDLADELGIGKGYISTILNGKRNPKDGRQRLESAFEAVLKKREAANRTA